MTPQKIFVGPFERLKRTWVGRAFSRGMAVFCFCYIKVVLSDRDGTSWTDSIFHVESHQFREFVVRMANSFVA